ncbi:AMP-binding protein [Psychrobacter sp. Pi2-1]|uniref:AMP-binding protein n=1 Tax=Psychrobacter sp. Pi2-1 TaxID=2774131 RepID=UPI001D104064|nr:AMP-binding protein [Psychrobacter sp. Pi2-1]
MTTSIDIDVNTKNNTSLSPADATVTKVTSAAPVSSQDHSENHAKSHADNTGQQIHNAPFDHAPQILEGCDTLSKLWRQVCLSRGDRIAHREKSFGIWQSYSWLDYYHHSCDIGMALVELGLSKGDTVSILSEDNKEWLYFDMGVCGVGGIPNGVYTTDSPEQLAYIVSSK